MHRGRISTYIVLSKDGESKECTGEGYPLTLSSAKTESPKNAPRKDIYIHCPQQRRIVQRMHQGRISTYIVLSKDCESKECTKEGYPLRLSSAKTESPKNAPRKDIYLHCPQQRRRVQRMHRGRISTYIVLSKDGESKECTKEGYPLTLSSAKTESPKNAPRKDIYLHCPQQRRRVQRMHQGRISTYIVLSKDGESKECTKEGYLLHLHADCLSERLRQPVALAYDLPNNKQTKITLLSSYTYRLLYKAAVSLCLSVCLSPFFFRHDRQTATKFGTYIRVDMGLILS